MRKNADDATTLFRYQLVDKKYWLYDRGRVLALARENWLEGEEKEENTFRESKKMEGKEEKSDEAADWKWEKRGQIGERRGKKRCHSERKRRTSNGLTISGNGMGNWSSSRHFGSVEMSKQNVERDCLDVQVTRQWEENKTVYYRLMTKNSYQWVNRSSDVIRDGFWSFTRIRRGIHFKVHFQRVFWCVSNVLRREKRDKKKPVCGWKRRWIRRAQRTVLCGFRAESATSCQMEWFRRLLEHTFLRPIDSIKRPRQSVRKFLEVSARI